MKTTKKTNVKGIETYLPFFKGFYGSGLDEPDFNGEAEHYKLPSNFDFTNYVKWSDYQTALSEKITTIIEDKLTESGFIQKIKFQSLHSPKEYNFTNDSINCIIYPKKQAIKNFIYDNKDKFVQYLEDRLKSRSGFISFHSHDFDTWEQDTKGFTDYDNKNGLTLGFLLDFICDNYEFPYDLDVEIAEGCMEVSVSEFYTEDFGILLTLQEKSRNFITSDNLERVLNYSDPNEVNELFNRIEQYVQRNYTLDINVKESTIKLFEQEEIGLFEINEVINLEGFIDSVMSEIASNTLKLELN